MVSLHSSSAHSSWSAHLDLPLAGGASAVRAQLPNGIRLTVVPNAMADVIAVRCFFRGGSSVECRDRAGVAALVAAVLTKGTERYSSQAIAREVESLGAGLGAESTSDYFEVSFKSVSADFPRLLTLVADVVRHATFPEREVEREQHLALQALQARRERPFTLAYERLRCELYDTHHPYARSPLGTPQSLTSISRADLVDYHRAVLQPDRLTIALAGNIAPDDAFAAIAAVFGDWSVTPSVLPEVSWKVPQRDRVTYYETSQDTQQAIVMVGYLAASTHSPDYVPLKLLSTYLGNGSSSRLFTQLRDKLGLAYEVTSLYATRQEPAPFLAYLGTLPESAATALDRLQRELDRVVNATLSADEVDSAKRKMLGQYALGKQTNGQLAQTLGWYECLGLGAEFDITYPELIANLTPDDLHAVAQTYLRYPVISVVGPQKALDRLKNAH